MSPTAVQSLLRRYAPLGVVLVVQLLLVIALPSTAAKTKLSAGGGSNGFVSPYATGAAGSSSATGAVGATAGGAAAANGAPGASGPGAGAGAGTSGPTGAAAGSKPGDTTHCVGDRQFDPAIDYYAPPCVPRFSGANSGGSYQGVTGSRIEIVDYYPQGNAAVDSALKAQGLYVSISQQTQWDNAVADFVNSHYELYGRKVAIDVVQGACNTIPPDVACLRNEMRQIVATKHPFMFRWITPLTSAPFDELSSLGVINVGGQMFSDEFSQARRPFHWDVHESGTQIARAFGQFWCSGLNGKPAAYSSAPPGPSSVNGQTRVLGIIGTNDPEDIKMREEVDRVIHGCGSRVAHTYDASNDLSTAASQKAASVASMRQAPSSTTVLCLCNPVGATFVYEEEQQEGYYPENVIAGTVYIDDDSSGQSFMSGSACPASAQCEFAQAFGLSSMDRREPVGRDTASRVWHAAGRPGAVPFSGATLDWDYFELMATLIQGAGPNLTPQTVEQGAFATPQRGGGATGRALRGFAPGSYAWNHDMAMVYWAPNRLSPFNGQKGTYVTMGPRLTLGQYSGPPPIPSQR